MYSRGQEGGKNGQRNHQVLLNDERKQTSKNELFSTKAEGDLKLTIE